jgi:hypothetical protein
MAVLIALRVQYTPQAFTDRARAASLAVLPDLPR